MRIKALLRRFALSIISQPRANVHLSLQQIKYGDILKNKSIVVIGGSKGIGLAIAKEAASEGAILRRKLIDNQISKWCTLLFVSSETVGKSNDLPYGLTKAALNSLVDGLARRVYNKGIRVNAIAPGVTLTDMRDAGSVDKSSDMSLNNAAGRWLLPEEMAEIACFMLSRASKSFKLY